MTKLKDYLNNTILPKYDNYDKGHNRSHILDVVNGVQELSTNYDVNTEMLHTAAIFHDLGLIEGRDTHHITSAKMLREDKFICSYFNAQQINTIAEAIEDHRASSKTPPRSIYGEILSSADRIIDTNTIIIRSYYHNEKHYPNCNLQENLDLIYNHITNKYGINGYLRIPITTQKNKEGLEYLRTLLIDEISFKTYCTKIIQQATPQQ